MDALATMPIKKNDKGVDEDWPISIRKPICGSVVIPKSLKEKIKTVMFRNKLKNYDSQASLL
jgi:hypothetical protein